MGPSANKCENLKPMSQWLEEDTNEEGTCRPCSIGTLLGYYQKALEKHGNEELSKQLAASLEVQDDVIMSAAKAMDTIKDAADESLRQELRELDCMAQSERLENE